MANRVRRLHRLFSRHLARQVQDCAYYDALQQNFGPDLRRKTPPVGLVICQTTSAVAGQLEHTDNVKVVYCTTNVRQVLRDHAHCLQDLRRAHLTAASACSADTQVIRSPFKPYPAPAGLYEDAVNRMVRRFVRDSGSKPCQAVFNQPLQWYYNGEITEQDSGHSVRSCIGELAWPLYLTVTASQL